MIIKSLAFCITLCVGYTLLVPYLPASSKGLQGGSQWEKNVFKEESLLCSATDYDVVIVGSSISATLVHLPNNWFNLAMASYSSITGLEVICNSNLKPCTILVETSNLNLGSTPYRQNCLICQNIKRQLPAFRSINKPSHVALRTLGTISGLKSKASQPSSVDFNLPDKRSVSDNFFEETLLRRLKAVSHEMDSDELSSRLARLKKSVEILDSRGFKIVFVEVPGCVQTYHASLDSQIRNAIKGRFKKSRYRWIDDQENCQMYATNDAIHLVPKSARRFTEKLVQEISEHSN